MASLPVRALSVRENAAPAASDSRALLADLPAPDVLQAPPLRGIQHEVGADGDGDPGQDDHQAEPEVKDHQDETDHRDADGRLPETGHLCLLLCGRRRLAASCPRPLHSSWTINLNAGHSSSSPPQTVHRGAAWRAVTGRGGPGGLTGWSVCPGREP